MNKNTHAQAHAPSKSARKRAKTGSHISSNGPKPSKALGHENLALQADQYKKDS